MSIEDVFLAGDVVNGFQELGKVARAMVIQGMKEYTRTTFGDEAVELFGEDGNSGGGIVKGKELTLVGANHRSWAIGGLLFAITAKSSKVMITSIEACSRDPGNWEIEVLMKKGRQHLKKELGSKNEWEVIGPKKSINFPNTSPTKVWEGKIVLKKGESVTIILNNSGNSSSGELVMDGEIVTDFPNPVKDTTQNDDIAVSDNFFLNRDNSFTLYPSIHCGRFVGKINYKK
eukprot:TRINITY_DN1244_c1_g1_i1.p1 TRINITY_DN1244_c1_g1~~TRINITY_DN1244_c1_g1_i1.p1  ORF type:complete len:231 (-),score=82.00 TRINITY_DN1244_c1_g1_i1:36-728(-)